uniref:Uncharacterized protein n=1 Tax=Anguilla anguilla TaxID=7936 RepID=A0A0E9XYJ6_ANGAN
MQKQLYLYTKTNKGLHPPGHMYEPYGRWQCQTWWGQSVH